MGLFSFLKGFFEEEKEPETIIFDELDSWIDSKKKSFLEQTKEQTSSLIEQVKDEKKKLIDNLTNLEDAEYDKKSNLPIRVIHTVDGNRKTYRQKTIVFVDKLNFPENFSKMGDFCDDFFKQLNEFAQNTSRNVQIISEIFGPEMSEISKNIKKIDDLINKIKDIFNKNLMVGLDKIKKEIDHINNQKSLKNQFKDKISLIKESLANYKSKIKDTENNIKKLKESKEYVDLLENKQKINPLIESKKSFIIPFEHNFSVINTALRKYEHISLNNKLLLKYIENPLKAIEKDDSFKIAEIIQKIKDSIISGKLKLHDNKKQKIFQTLNKLDKNYFILFLKKYNAFNTELTELNDKISNSNILEKIQETEKSLEHTVFEYNDKLEELKKLEQDYDDIDIKKLKMNLKDKIDENKRLDIKLII